jgi:hypothetical protein
MIWLSLDTTPGYGSLYQSGRYYIRHYTETSSLGFGIVCARAYIDAQQIGEWTGEGAMKSAMAHCEEVEQRRAAA